mmetsp:Transcript_1014/g.1902  ORF Transcript_1014/g.1902 Transcript_1014/m.1902 type:complete len:336 (-) Transcript_1014:1955-2962(-)
MRGADAGAIVAVEVLVEEDVVAPQGILPGVVAAEAGAAAFLVDHEHVAHALFEFQRDLPQVQLVAGVRGALDHEGLAVVEVVLLKALDEQEVDGIPDGPAPVRVAAEHIRPGFAWLIADAVFLAVVGHLVRVLLVVLGQRPDAVLGQELVGVQHAAKKTDEPLAGHQGQEDALVAGLVVREVDVLANVGPVANEPVEAAREVREALEHIGLEHRHGKHRHQPDQGANFDCSGLVFRRIAKGVVVEAICIVPHAFIGVVESLGDVHEVLEELGGGVLVGLVVEGELEGQLEHDQAVHRHPGRGVRLLHRHSFREVAPVEDPDIIEAKEASFEDVLV